MGNIQQARVDFCGCIPLQKKTIVTKAKQLGVFQGVELPELKLAAKAPFQMDAWNKIVSFSGGFGLFFRGEPLVERRRHFETSLQMATSGSRIAEMFHGTWNPKTATWNVPENYNRTEIEPKTHYLFLHTCWFSGAQWFSSNYIVFLVSKKKKGLTRMLQKQEMSLMSLCFF